MTVEADIFNLLKPLVSNRVYPDVAPAGAAKPYIVYQQVGGEALGFLGNDIPSKKNGRFQVSCWAVSRSAASTLALQVENAFLAATTMQARPLGAPASSYEADTTLYGTRQDFSVWSDR